MCKRLLIVMTILMVCALVLVCFGATAYAKKAVERPFKGTLVGQCQVTWVDGIPRWMDSVATGNLTHLGLTQMASRHPLPGPVEEYGPGDMTLAAANGDKLFVRYTGVTPGFNPMAPAGAVFESPVTCQIMGGTGRFAGIPEQIIPMTAYLVYPGPGNPEDPDFPMHALFVPWDVTWVFDSAITY